MNDSAFSALPAQTQAALAGISAAVAGVLPTEVRSWPIDATALPDEVAASSLLKEVSEWVGASKACLYYFDCRSADVDLATVERASTTTDRLGQRIPMKPAASQASRIVRMSS